MAKHNNGVIAELERLVGCEWAWILMFMSSSGSALLSDVETKINECRERNVRRTKVDYDICVQRVSLILKEFHYTRKQACLNAVFACLDSHLNNGRVSQVLKDCENARSAIAEENEEIAKSEKLAEAKA